MNIFDRLERAAKLAHSYELQYELRTLAVEGSLTLRDLSQQLDDEAMRKLNAWWTRAHHILVKCEGPRGAA